MKKNTIIPFVILLLVPVFLFAVRGPKDKNRPMSIPVKEAYHKLSISAPLTVTFSDTAKTILIDLPQEYRKRLTVNFSDGTLSIALRSNGRTHSHPAPIGSVVLPTNGGLDDIELRTAATLDAGRMERDALTLYLTEAATLKGNFKAKRIDIQQAGASSLYARLAVDNIALTLSAASSAELRGRALIGMTINLTEASSVDAEKFEARHIEGTLDGASHAILWCSGKLRIPLRNASHLTYIGHPIIVDCPCSDASTLIHK